MQIRQREHETQECGTPPDGSSLSITINGAQEERSVQEHNKVQSAPTKRSFDYLSEAIEVPTKTIRTNNSLKQRAPKEIRAPNLKQQPNQYNQEMHAVLKNPARTMARRMYRMKKGVKKQEMKEEIARLQNENKQLNRKEVEEIMN
jgi:hypothetical protein